MKSFREYINEQIILTEKLMVFGGKAYPKFGTVVIIAGGAGSGKGFQVENLIGVDGKKFDVDELKKLAMRSTVLSDRIKKETGHDIGSFDLRIPENVSKLHEILASYGITKRSEQLAFSSILVTDSRRKPNLIFDVTLKDLAKLESITRNIMEIGYAKENVHIVWVVNDLKVAIEQNKGRSRVVPEEILLSTHEGASMTMKKILDMGDKLNKYMDGDIYLSFNQVDIDTKMEKSDFGGKYVKEADYIRVKDRGKSQKSSAELDGRILAKIKEYTPDINAW